MRFFPLKTNITAACILALSILGAGAVDQLYVNSGSVTNPVINATGFLNEGYFRAITSLPYETASTLYYTNRGTMEGSVGFKFNLFTNGFRRWSSRFENESTITALDSSGFIFTGNGGTGGNTSFGSYIYVYATNVVNSGSLSVGANGLLRIDAKSANLRGSALLAGESAESSFYSFTDSYTQTNYFNESKVTDLYWGVGTNGAMRGDQNPIFLPQFTNGAPDSGFHQVIERFSGSTFTNTVSVPGFNFNFTNSSDSGYEAYAYVTPYTSATATGRVVQVVYVYTNSFNGPMTTQVRFASNGGGTRGAQVYVELGVADVDVISGLPITNTVYFSDDSVLATSGTNLLFLQKNIAGSTARPNPYDISLNTPFEWQSASPSNVVYTSALFYDDTYLNSSVTNVYSGYSAYIGSSLQATNSGLDPILFEPTNSVGRIEVYADQLDLNLTRIRSEGLLTLSTTNFTPITDGAKLDAQQMNLSIGSTNRELIISNFLSGSVRRLDGAVSAWSGVWSNQTAAGNSDIFHVLILDNQLTSVQTTTAYGFVARATNQPNGSVVLVDPISVSKNLLIDAENITIKNDLVVSADIGATNWPRLLNFTNEGRFFIPGNARFIGTNGSLLSFVNRSNLIMNGGLISAFYFENSGSITTSVGSLSISNSVGTANYAGGNVSSAIDLNIYAHELITSNATLSAGFIQTNFQGQPVYGLGGLSIRADRLVELGQSNYWTCVNGFRLYKLLPGGWEGDLLFTRLQSTVKPGGNVTHIWSGTDRGVSADGFTNNAALGHLVLDGGSNARFRFAPPVPGTVSAIYVDYLDLKNFATNFQTALDIDPFFRIYFASSSVPPEKLNNTHGGRLRWVQGFAGPNSSVDVLINGQIVKMNRALVESKEIDSDGDGLPNGFDPSPFDGVVIQRPTLTPPSSINLTWQAAANTTYSLLYTSTLMGTNTVWTPLRTVTSGSTNGPVTVQETVVPEPRYYQVRYTP